jgi:hypothetical protein
VYIKELKDFVANATLLGFFYFILMLVQAHYTTVEYLVLGFAACLQWRRDCEHCVQVKVSPQKGIGNADARRKPKGEYWY